MRGVSGAGELARTQLVQDLPRLGVAPGLVDVRLQAGEHEQRAARHLGVDHQRFAGRQQRVTAERCHVPRDPGRGQLPAFGRHHQGVQVAHGGVEEAVEKLVVRGDVRAPGHPGVVLRPESRGGLCDRRRPVRLLCRHPRDEERDRLAGRELEIPGRVRALPVDGRSGRSRVELDLGPAALAVRGEVGEADVATVARRGQDAAARAPVHAPDLEDVGEVGAQRQLDRRLHRAGVEVVHANGVMQTVCDHHGPAHVERLLRHGGAVCSQQGRVGRVDDRVVPRFHHRGEQDRLISADGQPAFREVAGVVGVEALPGRTGTDVPVPSCTHEDGPGLEREQVLVRLRRHQGSALGISRRERGAHAEPPVGRASCFCGGGHGAAIVRAGVGAAAP